MAKKFDIVVYDLTENGVRANPQPQNGIMAPSRKEVIEMFESCDQQVDILREYEDEESKDYGKFDPLKLKTDYQHGGGMDCMVQMNSNLPPEIMNAVLNPGSVAQNQKNQVEMNGNNTPIVKEPVKYFTVGGLKCKIENGKIYQKQWMRLSDEEMNEFRIVADKSNKICPLKDKHVEVLKWVLTEDNTDKEENTTNGGLILG